MVICVGAFTENGMEQIEKLEALMPEITWISRKPDHSLKAWVADCFQKHLPILFIGATGIAVRAIAPFVEDKLLDSPVLVMDEKGQFIISLLSGHMGGANSLARRIASATKACPVITTATDLEGCFAVDVFAKQNRLRIVNRDGIQKVSAKVLAKEKVSMWINPGISLPEDFFLQMPKELEVINKDEILEAVEGKKYSDFEAMSEYADIRITLQELPIDADKPHCLIQLIPKRYCVGMGCKKGKSFEEINSFALMILEGVLWKESVVQSMINEISAFASIDLKKEEVGLMTMAQYYHVPFLTYSTEELLAVEGEFASSDFVQKTTGVSNVCERSAMCLAGEGASLVIRRTACDGMTLAVAKCKPRLFGW